MTRAAGLLCVLLSVVCGPAFAANCWAPDVRLVVGQTNQRQMFVVSGKACGLILGASPQPMRGVRLIAPPTRGRIVISGHLITYVSRRGYLGEDHYVFVREGVDPANSWTVEVSVQVKERL